MKLTHLAGMVLATAALALAAPASAQDILIDVSFTPVYEISAPVAGVAAVPGVASKPKDNYIPPVATTKDVALWSNQCWVSEAQIGERMTAGTQGPKGVCIWNNGSLSTTFHGGRPGRPGVAAVDGVYGQGWAGVDIPDGTSIFDFSHEHDLIHEHTCTGQSAPSSC